MNLEGYVFEKNRNRALLGWILILVFYYVLQLPDRSFKRIFFCSILHVV